MAALSFVAGILIVDAVEDMLEEAREARSFDRRSILSFVGGFVLFILVSVVLVTIVGQGSSGGQGAQQQMEGQG